MTQVEVLYHDTLPAQVLLESRDTLKSLLALAAVDPSPALEVEVRLPSALLKIVLSALETLGSGRDLALVALKAELSPQDAATLLGVSRPHVLELLKAGALVSHRVGTHHRIALEAVLAYTAGREGGVTRVAQLTGETQDWGLY